MAPDFKVLKKNASDRSMDHFQNISKYIQTLECDIFMDIGENVLKIFWFEMEWPGSFKMSLGTSLGIYIRTCCDICLHV